MAGLGSAATSGDFGSDFGTSGTAIQTASGAILCFLIGRRSGVAASSGASNWCGSNFWGRRSSEVVAAFGSQALRLQLRGLSSRASYLGYVYWCNLHYTQLLDLHYHFGSIVATIYTSNCSTVCTVFWDYSEAIYHRVNLQQQTIE